MKFSRKMLMLLIMLVLMIVVGVGCATAVDDPETQSEEVAQEAADVPDSTDTPEPTDEPEPTDTLEPTNTPRPTRTRRPTRTPNPTHTSEPTNVLIRTRRPPRTSSPTDTPNPTDTPVPTDTPLPTNTPVPAVPATFTPVSPVIPEDCRGDTYSCNDFNAQWEAQRIFDLCRNAGLGDVHRLDQHGNGQACEDDPRFAIQPTEPPQSQIPQDCQANTYSCNDFNAQWEAQQVFDRCRNAGQGDIHQLDLNSNRQACEDDPRFAPQPTQPPQPTATSVPTARFIPEGDAFVVGSSSAPVTIVEYTDYQCPFCRRHFYQTYPQIKANYIDVGLVRYVFKDFPLDNHPQADEAAVAARCAKEQGLFMQMHGKLFEGVQRWSGQPNVYDIFTSMATEIGADGDVFSECVGRGTYEAAVTADLNEGVRYGVRGTPGFFVNGEYVRGAQPYAVFSSVIDSLLP